MSYVFLPVVEVIAAVTVVAVLLVASAVAVICILLIVCKRKKSMYLLSIQCTVMSGNFFASLKFCYC